MILRQHGDEPVAPPVTPKRLKLLRRPITSLSLVLMAAFPGVTAAPRTIDLSRLVVIGDSLSAGYANASLNGPQQELGYASRVARRAGFRLTLPLIDEPGIPNALSLVRVGPPVVILPLRGLSHGRVDLFRQPMNLAVPGARVEDTLTARPSLPPHTMTDLVLGFPGLFAGISRSQVEWAERLRPTTIFIWIGNNDALRAALSGDSTHITPLAEFRQSYGQMMDRLAATGATLVVANIPDVTAVPFLVPADTVAEFLHRPLSDLGPILGIHRGDYVTPMAAGPIVEILAGVRLGPLPPGVVLDANEAASVREAVGAFDDVIAAKAAEKGAALVDVRSFIAEIQANGLPVGGERLTTRYLGGVFSLDGVHLSSTGYAAIANEFIRVINARFRARIPSLSLTLIARADRLVVPEASRPASSLNAISASTATRLSSFDLP